MADLHLKCHCGAVEGRAENLSPEAGNRIVCCCDDCQAFADYLGRDDILDEYGGTDIFQLPPARVSITRGADRLRCLRLGPRGLIRWYTDCCNTPVGNTVSAGVPFIGMVHSFMGDAGVRDRALGPALGYVQTRFARRPPPAGRGHPRIPPRILFRAVLKVLLWKLRGRHRPSPFFDAGGKPVSEPHIVNSETAGERS